MNPLENAAVELVKAESQQTIRCFLSVDHHLEQSKEPYIVKHDFLVSDWRGSTPNATWRPSWGFFTTQSRDAAIQEALWRLREFQRQGYRLAEELVVMGGPLHAHRAKLDMAEAAVNLATDDAMRRRELLCLGDVDKLKTEVQEQEAELALSIWKKNTRPGS